MMTDHEYHNHYNYFHLLLDYNTIIDIYFELLYDINIS